MQTLITLPVTLPIFLAVILISIHFILGRHRRSKSRRLPPSPPGLPVIGHFHLLGPLLHREFQNLAERHRAPLLYLRLGSVPLVVASSRDMARELLKTHEICFAARPNTIASIKLTYSNAIAFAPYGPYWKYARRLTLTELLGPRPVTAFTSLRAAENHRLLRRLHKSPYGASLSVSDEIQRAASSVITKMVMGSSGMDMARLDEVRAVVRDVATIFGELNLSDFVWFLRWFDLQGFGRRIEDIFRRFDFLIESVIVEREEIRKKKKKLDNDDDDGDENSFLDVMLRHLDDADKSKEDENVQFNRLSIKGIIVDLFVAGTDTTAVSSHWAMAELINHPTQLKKVREEIDRVVGKTRLVNESDIPNLPYTQAVVKEVLRLHPPVPMTTRQCVKECEVGGFVIPKGSMVVVNSWAIGRDPEYWDSPSEFKPERFFEAQQGIKTVDVKGQNFELLPFGSGRRICPGMNMALVMVPCFVASLVQCFDFEVIGPKSDDKDGKFVLDMEEGPGITAPRVQDLVCVPTPRLANLSAILGDD